MKHSIKAVILGLSLLLTNSCDAYAQDLVKGLEATDQMDIAASASPTTTERRTPRNLLYIHPTATVVVCIRQLSVFRVERSIGFQPALHVLHFTG